MKSRLDDKLNQAGLTMSSAGFTTLSAGSATIAAVITIIWLENGLVAGLGMGAAVLLIFIAYLQLKINRRAKALEGQLPDVMALMANALRSGLGLYQSIQLVSQEMTPPIAQEFARVQQEIRLGIAIEDVLTNMSRRVRSDDLELMITSILIQRQTGGNLVIVLDNIAATVRERMSIKQELQTLTAQGKLSGWIVGILPIVLVLVIRQINPDYIQVLFTDPLGKMLLGGAVVSQLLGIIVIRRIINIEI
jgi:tight adherence protein B